MRNDLLVTGLVLLRTHHNFVGLLKVRMAVAESRPLFIRLTLPDGLEEALEGLAREVLRQQPDNILDFAANHFEQLVKKRGSSG